MRISKKEYENLKRMNAQLWAQNQKLLERLKPYEDFVAAVMNDIRDDVREIAAGEADDRIAGLTIG